MATVNLGRIKPVFRGAYSGSTAYVVDDIVTHGNESFICIQAHGAGTQATSQTAYWTKLAAKGADGTDVGTTLTTQGDILYRDGSGLAKLGAGTSGQALLTQGAGANPIWGSVGGGVLQAVWNANDTPVQTGSGSYVATNNSVTITPTASNSKILVILSGQIAVNNQSNDPWTYTRPYRNIGSGGYSAISDYRRYAPSAGSVHLLEDVHHFFIDAPTTTSAVTYKTYFHGGGTSIWFGGRSSGELSRTNAIAIELANGIA
jgi:hypothetical protein